MQLPVSISVVSNSLLDLPDAPPPSDALHFISRPIKEVFQNPPLPYAVKLMQLAALEVAYVEMVEGIHGNGWWALQELPLNIGLVSPIDMGGVLKARQRFSKGAEDIIVVGAPL